MPLWNMTDVANGSPISAPTLVNLTPNTVNQTNLYQNNTKSAFVNNATIGVFGMDTNEIHLTTGGIATIGRNFFGSGYSANATVTVSGNATANATANSIGRISAINVVLTGSGYTPSTLPTITISAPTPVSFNANTGVAANGFINVNSSVFQVGDNINYLVAAGNTAVVGLANNTSYYVVAANTTGVYLSSTANGTAITLTPSSTSETGHTLTGQTANVGAITLASTLGSAHSGWVIRRQGHGGRAGRVQYEVLVASGSISADANTDNSVLGS